MKQTVFIIWAGICIISASCQSTQQKPNSSYQIMDAHEQNSVFHKLMQVTGNSVPDRLRNDSLSFLILPVHASCPSCRKKTIDSIVKNRNRLLPVQFIIIAANGGVKTIGRYFKEQQAQIPSVSQLFLDSVDRSGELNLYDDKPTIYYTFNSKAFKKVTAIPSTIKEDLYYFFSYSRATRTTQSYINDKMTYNEELDNQDSR